MADAQGGVVATSDQNSALNLAGGVASLAEARERRFLEPLLRGQTEVLELIATGGSLDRVLTRLALLVEAQMPDTMCSVLLLDEGGQYLRFAAGPSLPDAYNRLTDGHEIGPVAGSCGTAAYRRERVIVSDIQDHPLWAPYRGIAQRFGLRSCWSTPIFSQHGLVLGTFAIYSGKVATPTPVELRLIDLASHIAAIAIDRKRAEGELASSDERLSLFADLRASEERFAIVFQSTPTSLVITTLDDGRVVMANSHFGAMSGYELGELVGRTVFDLGIWPDLRARAEALATLERVGRVDNLEAACRTKSGELRTQLLSMRKITLEGHDCVLTAGTDITDRARAEDERDALEEKLRQAQKMEAIGRLAGGIAHDFNNLLTAITGYTELLLEKLSAEDREDAIQIRHAAGRAAALTQQLLTFARRRVVQREFLDLNDVVQGMDKLLRPLLGADVELVTVLEPDLPPIEADRSQIEQVISNLAINGRDAMPGGGRLLIETASPTARSVNDPESLAEADRPRRWVCLRVQDTGRGIDPEALDHIFEPFFTTKNVGHGTGLGLATVHGIIEQAGGTIRVDSQAGIGSTIEIQLPAGVAVEPHVLGEAEPLSARSFEGSETILVIEDEEIVRELAARILRQHGYRVIEARYASEALELWLHHQGEIELVLSDIVMPGTSGPEFARHLAVERPNLKVVLMSGFADTMTARQSEIGRGGRFLEKPFTPHSLLQIVRDSLDSE